MPPATPGTSLSTSAPRRWRSRPTWPTCRRSSASRVRPVCESPCRGPPQRRRIRGRSRGRSSYGRSSSRASMSTAPRGPCAPVPPPSGAGHAAHLRSRPRSDGGLLDHVGVVGYTLGGGISWLGRKRGLASSRVTAVEPGRPRRRAGPRRRRQRARSVLGLRGGGGGFGAVTAIEFGLLEVPEIYAGMLAFPGSGRARSLEAWRGWLPRLRRS